MKKLQIAKLLNCCIVKDKRSNSTIQQYNNIKPQRGFTLIEILVAISIVGILSAFLLSNFVGVRERGRDTLRKSDLRQIQSALEFYRSDQGIYPVLGNNAGEFSTNCGAGVSFTDTLAGTTYMQKIPCDPSTNSAYTYSVGGALNTTYSVIACLENKNDLQKDAVNSDPPCDGTINFPYSYTVQSP